MMTPMGTPSAQRMMLRIASLLRIDDEATIVAR
jgi:hypothetical protein